MTEKLETTFESSTWRLVLSEPAGGAWNMALDEAILEAVGNHSSPPTLRLYAWDPACLSLGFSQPAGDADREALARQGWQLVRRPTGGRAILHTNELTYAVIAPADEPRVTGSVLESYRRLSSALILALQQLGLPVRAEKEHVQGAGAQRAGPVCFEVPSDYEITVDGKKLIGSAQARRHRGVLQHGSLPLCGDLTRIVHGLTFASEAERQEAAERLLKRATTVQDVLGEALRWDEAAAGLVKGFRQALNLDFVPGVVTPAEMQRAVEWVEMKYANEQWTARA